MKRLEENRSYSFFCCLVSVVLGNGFGICGVERTGVVVPKVSEGGFGIKAVGTAANNEGAVT